METALHAPNPSPDPSLDPFPNLSPDKPKKPLWKYFYYPMLAASLVLHGLLFAIPMPEKPQVAEKPEEKPEEIKLSSLTAPSPPSPTPQPKVAVPPKPIASPQAIARPAVPRPNPVPPPPRPVAPAPVPQTVPAPSPIASPTPSPTPDPYSAPFQDNLAASGSVQGQGIPYYKFPEPQLFFTPDSLQQADTTGTDPLPVEGSNPQWVSNVGAQDIIQKLPEFFPGTTIAEVGIYGGGKLYEARQGDAIRYVSVIEGTGSGLTTFVVTWNRDPRQPLAAPVNRSTP